MRPRKTPRDFFAQDGCRGLGLCQPLGRHLAVETGRQQPPALAVFEPVQHLAHDAKTRRHQAGCVTRVDAFGQHFHLQRPAGHAAQAGGQPKLVVVARARIQAHHQRHITEPLAQGVDVRQQIVGAALLARFHQADDARMRNVLRLEGLNRGDAGIHRVTVVGTAAAIQLAVLVFGGPGAQVLAPARELGLFVQVAVHQHGLGRSGSGRIQLKKQHRRAAFEAHHFQPQALHLLRLHPGRRVAHHRVDITMLRPTRVEARRLGRNLDVTLELPDDVRVPLGAGLGQCAGIVEHRGGNFFVQGSIHVGTSW